MTLKQRKLAYEGREAMFAGFDGKMYVATVAEVLPRGVRIEYNVTDHGETRICTAHLPTATAKERLIVQM